MSKNRRKAAAENLARFEAHARAKGIATKAAKRQQLVALGRELANGLQPVSMPSIADQMDEIDPRVRGLVRSNHTVVDVATTEYDPPSPALEFRRLHPPTEPFVPPKFQPSLVRESQDMLTYTSPTRVKPVQLGTGPAKAGRHAPRLRLEIPFDVVTAIGVDKLKEMQFDVELDEDGIRFRPAGTRVVPVPAWAKK